MKGNIYSRKRIKLPNLKDIKSYKIIMLILFFSILLGIILFLLSSYPVFKSSCETVASSKCVTIINDEVKDVMENYTYDDLISVEKDQNGKIVLIKTNSICINDIVSTIVSNVQKKLDMLPRVNVYINMGSVTRNKYIKKL